MTVALKRVASARLFASTAPEAAQAMIRFSIAPTDAGAWLWRTFDKDGGARSQGLAASRKQAAAFVIRDIVQACEPVASSVPELSAKAA